MVQEKDYYQILQVSPQASPKEIKGAYRRLALRFHPDRNRDNPEASVRMREINEAYAVLSDPRKRQRYDALRSRFGAGAREEFRHTYSEEDIFRGSDINQIFEEISRVFGFRGFEEVFRESYGRGYQSFQFRRPGFTGRAFVFRTGGPGPGVHGAFRPPVPRVLASILAHGMKKLWGLEWPERGRDWHETITLSPELARQGGKIHYLHRRRGKELLVAVPPGIRPGQTIRLQGMGQEGKGGAESGDLYLKVRIRHPLHQRLRDMVRRLFGYLNPRRRPL